MAILAFELPNGLVNIDFTAFAGILHWQGGIAIAPVPALDVVGDAAVRLVLCDVLFVLHPCVVARATEDDSYTRAAATVRRPPQEKENLMKVKKYCGRRLTL